MSKVPRSVIKPFLIPALQTSLLMSSGDVIAQTAIDGKTFKELNLVRTGQFAGIGLCLGPILGGWYKILSKYVGSGGGLVTFKKVAIDQCVFAPCFMVIFLSTLSTIQGDKPSEVVDNIKRHYADIMITNYKIFPAVQFVNFYFVPLKHQVLVLQSAALIFNTYLSWKTQSTRKQK